MTDPIAFAFQRGFGGALTPLMGKVPLYNQWQSLPPITEEEARELVATGYNLGLRTGPASGLFVIDDDQSKHNASGYVPPPTDLVAESPTGGLHYYYVAPDPCPGNSASKLAPYVDTRGHGGQVVYPGSSHPTLHLPYRWIKTGQPGALPPETLAVLRPVTTRVDMSRPSAPARSNGYADSALHREVHSVRTAAEGERNDTLNRAAFSLGQLVAGGVLDQGQVETELLAAASICGLPDGEARGTIRSGMKAGTQSPRGVPERSVAVAARPARGPQRGDRREVLIPGSHTLPPDGEYREQGNDAFARQVVECLPEGTVYRRGGVVGTILPDEGFVPTGSDLFRSVVDAHVRLGLGREAKEANEDGSTKYVIAYRPCNGDMARVVLAYAEQHGAVRNLKFLASHPVCVGPEFDTAEPGWNQASGVFLQVGHVPDALPLPEARAVLEDLVCDFPFQAESDRANYLGLLLTPILRPALNEPVPLHLIGSPVERTGKTKLAEIVLGCSVLGHPTPALQIGVREEEREKRITALLISGASVAHLDNLREFVDSPALASLLTSTTYQGRELGHSRIVSIPNGLTLVASGNNVHASGEIAKRVVPIRLLPPVEDPETRQDYRHPLLRAYVEAERERVLGALLGLVAAWKQAGQPLGGVGFGGFERWAAVLGGIMHTAGYPEWLTNLPDWRGSVADFGGDLRAYVQEWADRYGSEWVTVTDLFALAEEMELFSRQLSSPTERGRRTCFSQRVLNAGEGRVVNGLRIELEGAGKRRRGRAVKV